MTGTVHAREPGRIECEKHPINVIPEWSRQRTYPGPSSLPPIWVPDKLWRAFRDDKRKDGPAAANKPLIPAQAGISANQSGSCSGDPRLRGDERNGVLRPPSRFANESWHPWRSRNQPAAIDPDLRQESGSACIQTSAETRGRSSREIVSNFWDLLSFSQTFGADNRAIRVGSEFALIKPAFERHNYGDEKAPSLTMNFAKTLTAKRIAILPLLAFLTACSYGPERLHVSLENVIAKPNSHTFAAAVEVSRVRDPVGFISRFPNGGIRDVLAVEARVYLIHVDKASIERVAVFEDYGGIPNPKSAYVSGWRDDTLYVTLFGYGGHNSSWNGDQLDDPRYVYYEVPPSGTVKKIESLPENRTLARQTGPLQTPPFLRLGKGHLDVRIGIDDRPELQNPGAIFSLDPVTGQPSLTFLESPPTTP